MKNEILLTIIHDILTKMVTKIDFSEVNDETDVLIGLFASLGKCISAFEPDRKMTIYIKQRIGLYGIIGYNDSDDIIDTTSNKLYPSGYFRNGIKLMDNHLEFSDKEIDNIFYLHEKIMQSKYFLDKPNYDNSIDQKEIVESELISTFYCFLSIFMQNKHNASILLSENNIKKSLSLFEMAKQPIPTVENSFLHLSHYLEKAIFDQIYNYNAPTSKSDEILLNTSIRFVKMNFGKVIYSNTNDDKNGIIKSNANYFNAFCCNRPFDSKSETFYEIKINKIGSKNVFIGFINSEDKSVNKAFGFGCLGYNGVFCRKSPFLNKGLNEIHDDVVIKEHIDNNVKLDINEGDRIGCYYTEDFVYLTINGVLLPYRLSHKSLKSYVPVIFIGKDEMELEVVRNVSFVDHSDGKYGFLNLSNLPKNYFDQKDINTMLEKIDDINCSYNECLIGSFANTNKINESKIFMNSFKYPKSLLNYQYHKGIIRDIIPVEGNEFVYKTKIDSYNMTTLSKEIIDIDVENRFFNCIQTSFFNIIENRMNTKFGINASNDIRSLPNRLKTSSNLNEIRSYIKNKTIKDNSKSIAIIMSRYLVFIMIDYLRYSKSKLLQDEGINSDVANCVIKSLAHSLPTITMFKPWFNIKESNVFLPIDETIFKDDIDDQSTDNKSMRYSKSYFNPGYSYYFDELFKSFLKQSEHFLSPLFISKLLQELFEITNKNNSASSSSSSLLYDLISSNNKIESLSPLPEKNFGYNIQNSIFIHRIENANNLISGFLPILLSSIPNDLPCAFYSNKGFRNSSDKVSCFQYYNGYVNGIIKWDYKTRGSNENKNFKLQFGIFPVKYDLQEFLLNGPLGYI